MTASLVPGKRLWRRFAAVLAMLIAAGVVAGLAAPVRGGSSGGW